MFCCQQNNIYAGQLCYKHLRELLPLNGHQFWISLQHHYSLGIRTTTCTSFPLIVESPCLVWGVCVSPLPGFTSLTRLNTEKKPTRTGSRFARPCSPKSQTRNPKPYKPIILFLAFHCCCGNFIRAAMTAERASSLGKWPYLWCRENPWSQLCLHWARLFKLLQDTREGNFAAVPIKQKLTNWTNDCSNLCLRSSCFLSNWVLGLRPKRSGFQSLFQPWSSLGGLSDLLHLRRKDRA